MQLIKYLKLNYIKVPKSHERLVLINTDSISERIQSTINKKAENNLKIKLKTKLEQFYEEKNTMVT